ncbi:MAG: hypothetical protein H0T46_26525 [Deltaproteobacteria bacterium]|nr:hypothetical protein [Deltaproteobacteria bacterium]
MTDDTSFMESVGLVIGAIAFLMWVVSDVLEEQLIGEKRRERHRVVKARSRAEKRKAPPPAPRSRPPQLPRARVHRV